MNYTREAMIAAVRYAAKFPFFSDLPDEQMWARLKPIVKNEWMTEPIVYPSPTVVGPVQQQPLELPKRGRPPKYQPPTAGKQTF